MINIELFNLTVAEVLGECYENFPERINLKESDVAYKVLEYYSDDILEEHPDFTDKLFGIASATVAWLEQAGFIWVEGRDLNDFYRVTLSSKGLELLNLVPDSITNKESIGTSFINGAKSVGKDAVLSAIKLVLSEGAKLAIKGGI